MKARMLVTTALVLLSCAGLVGTAHALPTEDGAVATDVEEAPSTVEEAEATEAAPGPVEHQCGAAGSPTEPTVAARLTLAAEADCAWRYYCRRVDVARVQKSVTGLFVAFKFWHWIRWCWKDNRTFNITTGHYLTDVANTMQYAGVVSAWAGHYVWCCRLYDSGYVTHRQIRMDNCVFSRCFGSWYPWVRIRAHGDGSYTYRVGS